MRVYVESLREQDNRTGQEKGMKRSHFKKKKRKTELRRTKQDIQALSRRLREQKNLLMNER